jgi:uncharacterized protein (TIGR00304 family)
MNKYFVAALICLVLAIFCIAASVINNEGAFHIFIIFPVITVNSALSGLGALFIILTFIFVFVGFASGFETISWEEYQRDLGQPSKRPSKDGEDKVVRSKKMNIQGSGVVLLGPIPIVFGSNQKLTLITVVVVLAIMIVAFLFFII